MEKNQTVWSQFREFINNTPIGGTITRQTLIKGISGGTENYIDYLRNLSERLGHLETVKPGHYTVLCPINGTLSVSKFRKLYNAKLNNRLYGF